MSEQRKTRTAFCKDDQDQLAAFLANHPGPRSGNALYQAFALVNNSHTWQSWRNHYMKNTEMIETIIRRIQNQKKQDGAKIGDSISSNQKKKGKERAAVVEVTEIDTANESPRKDQSKKRPASESLEDLTLTRIQNEKRLKGAGPQSALPGHSSPSTSSVEVQPSNSDGSTLITKDPGITMTSEEEQYFLEYLSRYPAGDIRLSMNLYEKYHRHAPRWSPQQYQAYYLAHRQRLDTSSALQLRSHHPDSQAAKQNCGASARRSEASNGVVSPPTALRANVTSSMHPNSALLPNAGQVVNPEDLTANAGQFVGPETCLPNARQAVGPEALVLHASRVVGPEVSKEDRFLGIHTPSVSMDSSDDLNLKYIPMSPDHLKVAKAPSISADLFGSFSKQQETEIRHSDSETSTEEDEGDLRLLRRIRGHQNVIRSLVHHSQPESNAARILSREQVKKATAEDRVRERGDAAENQIRDHFDQNGVVKATRDQLNQNRAENQTRGQTNHSGAKNQTLDQLNQNRAGQHTPDKQSRNGVDNQVLHRPEQSRVRVHDRDPPEQNRGSNSPEGLGGTQTFSLTSGPANPIPAPGKSPLKSGMTSRTNSFKPAKDPTSIDEAIALVSEFLDDFGDLYSARDALGLFHQCGNWTLMFEVATLRRMELEGGDEVDRAYADTVKALLWTQEEDHVLLEFDELSSTPSELFAEMGAKMRALESKKGHQAIANRREFLHAFLD